MTAPDFRHSATAAIGLLFELQGVATPLVGPVASGNASYHAWHANAWDADTTPTPSDPAVATRSALRTKEARIVAKDGA